MMAWARAHRAVVGVVLIGVLVLPWYLFAANAYWVGDDYNYVVPKSLETVLHFFDPVGRAVYRPLNWLTWAADWTLFGDQPLGWHLTGFLMHALNVTAAGLLVRAITRRGDVALVTALLFALHPSAPETATWVGGRADLSFAGAWLVALWLWVRWRQGAGQGRGLWLLASAFGVLAMLGKEAAVTLPLASLWIDLNFGRTWARWPGRRDAGWWRDGRTWLLLVRDHAPFLVVAGGYVALRLGLLLTAQGRAGYGLDEQLAFFSRIPDVLAGYVLLVPGGWWLPQEVLSWPLAAKWALIAVGLLGAVLLFRWLGRMAGFAIGWVPITLLLTTQGVANRWFYVPALGVSLLIACIWARLWGHPVTIAPLATADPRRPTPQPPVANSPPPVANPQPPTPNPHKTLALALLVVTVLAWGTLTAAHNREWIAAGEAARGILAQIRTAQPDPPRPATFYVANPPYGYQHVLLFNTGFTASINLLYHDWAGIKSYDLVSDAPHVQAALADAAQVGPHPVFLRYEAGRIVLYPSLAALVAANK